MRGFFGVGAEGISKGANLGALVRSAHAFGGSFFFTVGTGLDLHEVRASDTSDAFDHLPFYDFPGVDDLRLPQGCRLVGVELTSDAIELPSFRHPTRAAYILGPEMGSLSPQMQEQCDFIIKIPTKFCVNVGVAGALVLYDRMVSMGRFADRPVTAGGPHEAMPDPLWSPRAKSLMKAKSSKSGA
jgi:tRNA G18 (ribose-2'-O)-methylase SpoU